jgi:hypothetical protein
MIPVGDEVDASLTLDDCMGGGTQMGKRYVDDAGAAVLVTTAGAGSLSTGSTLLTIKKRSRYRPATRSMVLFNQFGGASHGGHDQ